MYVCAKGYSCLSISICVACTYRRADGDTNMHIVVGISACLHVQALCICMSCIFCIEGFVSSEVFLRGCSQKKGFKDTSMSGQVSHANRLQKH